MGGRTLVFAADGESGKKYGNETVRITPDGEVSIRLPAPLEHLANARNGRYVLTAIARFQHRGAEWAERIAGDRAVAYRIQYDATRGRWYVGASWQRSPAPSVPLAVLRSGPVIGVDTNVDHLAAWKLDPHGNPMGRPKTFGYDLSGTADHRDAQLRHALSQVLRWARSEGVRAIAVEDLDFGDSTTREKHGRRKRFRQLISCMPTGKLGSRLVSMAAETGVSVIAVDPAYTSKWGNEHWRVPLSRKKHEITRHHAASVAIGRRALGHGIRRRVTPPRHDQSDRVGHRTIQAQPRTRGWEGTRPDATGTRTRSVLSGRRANAGTQFVQHRSGWTQ
ncbi:IS200/IS605 family accessory protein TnpB-related protein [Saccharopolyspora sp. NPDC049357]|uniref:IS200/IS605 family accessory protein TnpB-related protein n=1 Tax=Saccharopolyspora sp. NPDC049357 TaxID=3154507 RepID=UPI003440BE2B